jgi:hypothetical protein
VRDLSLISLLGSRLSGIWITFLRTLARVRNKGKGKKARVTERVKVKAEDPESLETKKVKGTENKARVKEIIKVMGKEILSL